MVRNYVTFGQAHAHRIDGVTLECDCVASYTSPDAESGRAKAFELFGRKFCFHYTENEIEHVNMNYFPRGVIDIDG